MQNMKPDTQCLFPQIGAKIKSNRIILSTMLSLICRAYLNDKLNDKAYSKGCRSEDFINWN